MLRHVANKILYNLRTGKSLFETFFTDKTHTNVCKMARFPQGRAPGHLYLFTATVSDIERCYSIRNASTGFAAAARTAWKLTVSRAMAMARTPARMKVVQSRSTR